MLQLTLKDFKSTTYNRNNKYQQELLYIFSPKVKLYDAAGELREIQLYIKLSILKNKIIVISFHEAEYSFD